MARRKPREQATHSPQQPYDSALKGLMENHADEIIPQFLPDTHVIRERYNMYVHIFACHEGG